MENKLILLATIAIIFLTFNCEHSPKTKVEGDNVIVFQEYEISTIEYDRHDYIVCAGSNGGGTSVTMIHSASCKMCSK